MGVWGPAGPRRQNYFSPPASGRGRGWVLIIYYVAMGLTILSNALYHVFQKLTPSNVNPMLALSVTYLTAAGLCIVMLPLFPLSGGFVESMRQVNWTSFALGLAVVGLELGFLLAYRAGWNVSLGSIVSNTFVGLLLLPVGLLFFREHLSPVNVLGIVACAAGLVMINLR